MRAEALSQKRVHSLESAHAPAQRGRYLLRYTRDFPLAIVEAKASYKSAADGLQQAKEYAEMLGLKFAYATNGHEIIEFDYHSGRETTLDAYPAPDELWRRYRTASGITGEDIAECPQAETAAELEALLPTILYRAFKGGVAEVG